MSDTTTETDAAEVAEDNTVAGESTADNTEHADQDTAEKATDWEAEARKLQKINRDLEKKVKGEAGTLRRQIEELQAKLEGREKEYAEEQERRKIEAEALSKANERILKAEIRAAAASRLADPNDALRFIDLDGFEVGDDGEVDRESITAAIEELVGAKPYLAAQGGTTTGPVFESPGTHRKGGDVGQLTRDDLARMSPDQINAARAEGRLDDLLGINH